MVISENFIKVPRREEWCPWTPMVHQTEIIITTITIHVVELKNADIVVVRIPYYCECPSDTVCSELLVWISG